MNPQDGSPAPQDPVAPVTPTPEAPIDYSNPNDLDFELSEEQEQKFVDEILKTGDYTTPAKEPEAPVAPVVEPVVAPVAPVEPPVEPVKPDEPVVLADPKTDDLWIEVEQTVVDDLGDETTKTVKLVYDPKDPGAFIPDDFTAKNTKQLADIMEAKADMAKLYGERQAEFDTAKAAEDQTGQEKAIIDGWNREIEDLVNAGILEAPKLKPTDQGYNEDPAVVKTEAVFKFMVEQNAKRVESGLSPIGSFGTAFTLYEKDAAVIAEAEAKKQADLDTKTAGAMVGGGSAASGGSPEPKAYVAGSHNNIWSVEVPDA